MTCLQLSTLVVGCTGIIINMFGVILNEPALSYISVFIGRLAALLFSITIDRVRWFYFFPITISFTNSFFNIEQLLFVELVFQSVIYQFSAYRLFTKGNDRNTITTQ